MQRPAQFISFYGLLLGISLSAYAAPQPYTATLAGHAVLPAQTFIKPPADAPADLRISGKFIEGKRAANLSKANATRHWAAPKPNPASAPPI